MSRPGTSRVRNPMGAALRTRSAASRRRAGPATRAVGRESDRLRAARKLARTQRSARVAGQEDRLFLPRPSHRAIARAPHVTTPPAVERDPDIVNSFLSDAAHVPGGSAQGVVFPSSVDEVAAIVAAATRVLPVGAQSSLTGGATPRGDLVLSTRRLSHIAEPHDRTIRVGAGVPLAELHRFLGARHLYYPPAPTYDGAFVGGTIATNAAGPATFKYGVTRDWVQEITVVLADGSILDIRRGDVRASDDDRVFEIEL